MSDSQNEITQFIEAYFKRQSDFDGEGMLEFWHPAGKMHLVGNQGEFRVVTVEEQANHVKEARERMPDLSVEFVLDEIEQVIVHEGLIASVHVRYRMIFLEGYGKHRCFYQLANMDGQWGIVSSVDRGFQVMPE